jgi:hypothetical protein
MYAISDPGSVPGFTSEGLHINSNGDVVGVLKPVSGFATKAFLWKGTGTLGVLSSLGFGAEARAINDFGEIAGAAESSPGRLAAVIWDASGTLVKLAEPAGAINSFTHGIDNSGHVAGGFIQTGPREVPLVWTNLHAPAAAPLVAPMPASAVWSEALAVRGGAPARACGTSQDTSGRPRAFVWNTATNVVDLLAGESAVAFMNTDVVGAAEGKPAFWSGGAGAPTILPGVGGINSGIANSGTGPDEVVGTVAVENIPSTARPFLRRRFRRDELDPTSPPLFPKILQLATPETIDLNSLLPPNSGWTLLTATAVNERGQITGTGTIGGQSRAYRLSPPTFESPLSRLLGKVEVLILFGGVAAGGGGFGITPSGHIIPIPPPRPDAVTVEHVVRLARETVRETAAYAEKTGQTELFRSVAKAVAEEVAAVLRG